MDGSTRKVNEAIEGLYQAFADQPLPPPIDGCLHCFEEHELDYLLSKPPRELTAEELSSYAASAFLTAGDVPDYLYLLPRIIDITVNDRFFWPDIEITGRAIMDSGFHSWPENRKHALLAVFHAYLEQSIERQDSASVDSVICALGRIDLPLGPYLAKIAQSPDAVLGYWEWNAEALLQGKLDNAFWEPSRRQDEVVEWFNTPEISMIYAEEYGRRFVK